MKICYVRFLGIAEKKDENCRDIIEQLLQRKFGTVGGAIENAHRSGMQGGNQARQVIARFYSRATRLDVIRAARLIMICLLQIHMSIYS